jgi:hypothetical protein
MYRVAVVCEGPADRAIIVAILDYYLEDYESLPIQPPITAIGGDSGPFGGGWKGVRAWCRQESSLSSGNSAIQDNSDLLIIQADTDIAAETEIGRAKACPPPHDGADEVRVLLLEWLDMKEIPENTVFCVPSMASETWALVALFPRDAAVVPHSSDGECIECRTDIKALLKRLGRKLNPKLVVSQGGALKNQAQGYVAQQLSISKAWPEVVKVCGEAARFDVDLHDLLPAGA